jgi:hypothetical protein
MLPRDVRPQIRAAAEQILCGFGSKRYAGDLLCRRPKGRIGNKAASANKCVSTPTELPLKTKA